MAIMLEEILLEGKIEDFIQGNNLSKDDAFSDENIAKLKKILKINADKTRAKLEKYFKNHPDESSGDSEDSSAVDIPPEAEKAAEDLPEDKKKLWKTLYGIIANASKKYAADKAGKLLDELLIGNFRDAVLDIYAKKSEKDFADEKNVAAAIGKLKEFDGYKKAAKKKEQDSRKDSETNTEIDIDSMRFMAMWYSSKKEENIGVILSDLVKNIQQNAKKLEDDMKKLGDTLKKMKIELSDEELKNFAPVVMKMRNDKASEEDIKKTVAQLKKQVNESMRGKLLREYGSLKVLQESQFMVNEGVRNRLMLESVYENRMIMEAVTERMLREGWFGDKLAKLKNTKAAKFVKDQSAKLGKKMADIGSKGIQAVTKYSIGPILQLGGIAIGVITGGLGAELLIKAMDFIEKNGKGLRNTFERCATMYANSKGVITKMNYTVGGDKNKKYSMRFYQKDMVWRVLNVSDQLKHPSKDYVKKIIDGDLGKKYRERLKQIWDPLFSDAKGGKIDFVKLLEQVKSVKISEKALAAFKDFAENYNTISSNCIDSPKIDTRAQK